MSVDFGRLWNSPHAGVMASKRDIVAFAAMHEAPDGFPKIVVGGNVRRVVWEPLGAGLYHVTTVADVIEQTKTETA